MFGARPRHPRTRSPRSAPLLLSSLSLLYAWSVHAPHRVPQPGTAGVLSWPRLSRSPLRWMSYPATPSPRRRSADPLSRPSHRRRTRLRRASLRRAPTAPLQPSPCRSPRSSLAHRFQAEAAPQFMRIIRPLARMPPAMASGQALRPPWRARSAQCDQCPPPSMT